MRVQRSRTDPLPLTWEIPTALVGGWLLLAVLALPAGQGCASLLAGHRFVWPHGTLVASVAGLVTGDVGQGLPHRLTDELAGPSTIYASIAAVEAIFAAMVVWGFLLWWRSAGPGAQYGIAARRDVERVLGPANLRHRRRTVRPDTINKPSNVRWRRNR